MSAGVLRVVGLAAIPALVLAMPSTAAAQQVCYAYDSLARLSGVIDENNNAAFYDYDAVGNILSIRRASPSGPVTIYAVDLLSGAPGAQFEIFGVGFSPNANQNQVTIGGVSATILSVVPCTLTVEVPANGISGSIRVVTPLGEATWSESFLVSRFAIATNTVAVLPNGTAQFTVVSNGCSDPAVVWRVNGIAGGTSAVGTISATGLYAAPAVVPTPAFVIVRAESVACPTLVDEKTLNVVRELTYYVFAAARATYGSPPAVFPPMVVMHSVSARNGDPPIELPTDTVASSASAAIVPVITAVAPNSARRNTTVAITVSGANLTGATGLTFLGDSAPDTAITVSNIAVNAGGTTLTANVVIAGTATIGTHTIRADHPGGNSTVGRTGVNVFTVTQ